MPPLDLCRRRILNRLSCPPRVLETVLAVSGYFECEGGKLSLETLADLMGHPGQSKFAQRAVKESDQWQQQANIQFYKRIPGERNKRGKVTEFHEIRVNDAAIRVSQQVSKDTRTIHTLAKIDEYCDPAIQQFLRKPLAAVAPPKRPRPVTATGGSVISSDTGVLLSDLGLRLLRAGFRPAPAYLDLKRACVTGWQQPHSEQTIIEWSKRFTTWGIACGSPLPDGGFLGVLDKDRHGPTFGDGFTTISLREVDLGPLPNTYSVSTRNSGEHCYFRTCAPLPNSQGLLGPGLDFKGAGGFVLAAGNPGYEVVCDLPIAQLPESWERALTITRETKRRVREGERHDYLCKVAYAMACQGKQIDEIVRTLRLRLQFNCEQGGRTIDDQELQSLAVSAVAKITRAEEMLRKIVA